MAVFQINQPLAQQIVDMAKEIVGQHINFINREGIIIGSTDSSRIGNFHEAGFRAIQEMECETVEDEKTFIGSKRGINYPIWLENQVVAVIGITGEPEEITKYGYLVTKLSEIFIKESYLNFQEKEHDQIVYNLILSFVYGDIKEAQKCLRDLSLKGTEEYALLYIQYADIAKKNQREADQIHKNIVRFMQIHNIRLHTQVYPNRFYALLEKKQYNKIRKEETFSQQFQEQLYAGVSMIGPLTGLEKAFSLAKTARKQAKIQNKTIMYAEDMGLDLVINDLNHLTETILEDKYLKKLCEEEISILVQYFQNQLSLAKTAQQLHVHKNTLQYKLNKIKDKVGKDPRVFQDAVELYIAIKAKWKNYQK